MAAITQDSASAIIMDKEISTAGRVATRVELGRLVRVKATQKLTIEHAPDDLARTEIDCKEEAHPIGE
jgi:hypothetical protein